MPYTGRRPRFVLQPHTSTWHDGHVQPPQETFIRAYDNLLTREQCDRMIDAFMASRHIRPGITQETDGPTAYKICDELYIEEVYRLEQDPAILETWREIDRVVFEAFGHAVDRYANEFKALMGLKLRDEGVRFKRYPKGVGHFGLHLDHTPGTPTRQLATVLYLNDVEEGGETEFVEYGIKVKPKAGTMAIFPPFWFHPHIGHMPVSGDKFIVNNFPRI